MPPREISHHMRKLNLVVGLAAAALVPTLASAQSSCEQQRNIRVVAQSPAAALARSSAARSAETLNALIERIRMSA